MELDNAKEVLKDLVMSSELALTALKVLKSNCSEVVWLEESISKSKEYLKENQQ